MVDGYTEDHDDIVMVLTDMLDVIEYEANKIIDIYPTSEKKRISFDENTYIHYIIDRDYLLEHKLKKKMWYTGEDVYRFAYEAKIIKNILKSGYAFDEETGYNMLFPTCRGGKDAVAVVEDDEFILE